MDKFLIYGASGHGKVIAECIIKSGAKVLGFFDDAPNCKGIEGFEFFGPYNSKIHPELPIILAVGDNKIREEMSKRVVHEWKPVIHPSAILSRGLNPGAGTVIMAAAVIQTGTVIGRHCIINTGASVDHDCEIDDFVHISPSATLCGGVKVGKSTQIGAGTVIIQNISIGKGVIIGAGSVIINDVPDYSMVVGNPGRVIKTIE